MRAAGAAGRRRDEDGYRYVCRNLTERQQRVLRIVVQEYVQSATCGQQLDCGKLPLGVSSATIL